MFDVLHDKLGITTWEGVVSYYDQAKSRFRSAPRGIPKCVSTSPAITRDWGMFLKDHRGFPITLDYDCYRQVERAFWAYHRSSLSTGIGRIYYRCPNELEENGWAKYDESHDTRITNHVPHANTFACSKCGGFFQYYVAERALTRFDSKLSGIELPNMIPWSRTDPDFYYV